MKVNSDDLDKYLNILESNTFDFDLKGYEVKEAKFFRYGGSFHDTKITSESMEEFLKENQDYFKILVDEHIKKIKREHTVRGAPRRGKPAGAVLLPA